MNDSTLQSESRISDEQLACQAQAGRSSCFAELVGRHERRLLTFLFRRIGSLGEAEDLLQDTFVRAWRNLDQYDPRWRVTTWLYTIVSRLAASHYRKTRSRPQAEADLTAAASRQTDPADEVAAREQRDNLWALARRVLSEEQYARHLAHRQEMQERRRAHRGPGGPGTGPRAAEAPAPTPPAQ